MPSRLRGLIKKLVWGDFPEKAEAPPAPGKTASAAYTHSSVAASGLRFDAVKGSSPPQFRLKDSLSVSVTFTRNKSWVKSWVEKRPAPFAKDMLKHEQGHYSIAALLARDFFIDMMLLKSKTFSSRQAGSQAVQTIRQQTLSKTSGIHTLYDDEVHPEQQAGKTHGPKQKAWDKFFQSAFTKARTPASQSPDGKAHKVRLVDVLKTNGKHI